MNNTTLRDKGKTMVRGWGWAKARSAHLSKEGECQMCGRRKDLEVHHIAPWDEAPEYRLDPKNLITLCRPCHFRFGHFGYWRDSNPRVRLDCRQVDFLTRVLLRRKG
jgi:hypothetical protein